MHSAAVRSLVKVATEIAFSLPGTVIGTAISNSLSNFQEINLSSSKGLKLPDDNKFGVFLSSTWRMPDVVQKVTSGSPHILFATLFAALFIHKEILYHNFMQHRKINEWTEG
jgi:hypothetical protein